jgi:hypothetical protein
MVELADYGLPVADPLAGVAALAAMGFAASVP